MPTIAGGSVRTDAEALMERLPVAVFRATPEGEIVLANAALAELLGYRPDELRGIDVQSLAVDAAGSSSLLDRLTSGGHTEPLELQFRRGDGDVIWVRTTAHRVLAEDDTVRYVEGTMMDITEDRKTRDELATAEERFRTAFTNAPIGMVISTPNTQPRRANEAFLQMIGHTQESFLGTPLTELMGEDAFADAEARTRQLETGELDDYTVERRITCLDGSHIWILAHVSAVREPDGTLRSILTQAVDITEERQIKHQLHTLVRSKDELVRSVSHELRTPLTTVVGLATELNEHGSDLTERDRQECIKLIAEQSAEMADLVNDLLVAARADPASVEITTRSIDVVDEVARVVEAWRVDAVDLQAPSTDAIAEADPFRVRQIVRNLLSNAFKYGALPISVVIRPEEAQVAILVRDTGPVLPESEWEGIFDAYYSARQEPGLAGSVGLGLTVSRNLARLMHGDLRYRSHEGCSEFVLTLPRGR